MKEMLMYAWQFPQNILGVILLQWYRPNRLHILEDGTEVYFSSRIRGGLTMGRYVFINSGHYRKNVDESLKRNTVRQKAIGMTRISRYFGWLYLLIAFLPCVGRWADRIAKVERYEPKGR